MPAKPSFASSSSSSSSSSASSASVSSISIFIFRRDLRLVDNTALLAAAANSGGGQILPIFIFPPEQIDPSINSRFSNPAVQFMCESLSELDEDLRILGSQLWMFKGDNTDVLEKILNCIIEMKPSSTTTMAKRTTTKSTITVYQNRDYSVYSIDRDKAITALCSKFGVKFVGDIEDYGLLPLSQGLDNRGRPPQSLGQLYSKINRGELTVRKPDFTALQSKSFVSSTSNVALSLSKSLDVVSSESLSGLFYNPNTSVGGFKGGRSSGVAAILAKVSSFIDYDNTRSLPSLITGTTRASPHLRFGTISVREFWYAGVNAFGSTDHPLLREVVFREWYIQIYGVRPELQRGIAIHSAMDKTLPWISSKENPDLWRCWVEGKTGFPICDAGMRQLAVEGWCHNRVRMVVASVATRLFFFDWRECERFYYSRLVDADIFSNVAGWQDAAGVGSDVKGPWKSAFNPFLQSLKFDNAAVYIKRWIPELRDVAAAHIHSWSDPSIRASYPECKYPAPVIDYQQTVKRSNEIWAQAAKKANTNGGVKNRDF
jgi:deoxyribodipyrimidine photo-lyase